MTFTTNSGEPTGSSARRGASAQPGGDMRDAELFSNVKVSVTKSAALKDGHRLKL